MLPSPLLRLRCICDLLRVLQMSAAFFFGPPFGFFGVLADHAWALLAWGLKRLHQGGPGLGGQALEATWSRRHHALAYKAVPVRGTVSTDIIHVAAYPRSGAPFFPSRRIPGSRPEADEVRPRSSHLPKMGLSSLTAAPGLGPRVGSRIPGFGRPDGTDRLSPPGLRWPGIHT